MDDIFEKLKALESGDPSNWMADAAWRRANRAWRRKSAIIALKVLGALRAQSLSQKDLAEKMGVTPQHVSKIVKGHENLTLETISKLEEALGIKIIADNSDDNKSAA
ncbi:MAG TPA: helix-turn-helix transcriptional regulator [Chitinophaga sp.]